MNLIRQLSENINNTNLSMSQSYCLLLIYSSPTEDIALEIINQNDKFVVATAYLKRMNLINYSPSGYKINNSGLSVLKFNGYIDDNLNLTSNGKQLLRTNKSIIE
jgi:hypothetical protein